MSNLSQCLLPRRVWADWSVCWGAADPESFKWSLPHFKYFFCCPLLLLCSSLPKKGLICPHRWKQLFFAVEMDMPSTVSQSRVLLRCLHFWTLVSCWYLASRQELEQFQWQPAYGVGCKSGVDSRQDHLRQRQALGQVYLWDTEWFLTAKSLNKRKETQEASNRALGQHSQVLGGKCKIPILSKRPAEKCLAGSPSKVSIAAMTHCNRLKRWTGPHSALAPRHCQSVSSLVQPEIC